MSNPQTEDLINCIKSLKLQTDHLVPKIKSSYTTIDAVSKGNGSLSMDRRLEGLIIDEKCKQHYKVLTYSIEDSKIQGFL